MAGALDSATRISRSKRDVFLLHYTPKIGHLHLYSAEGIKQMHFGLCLAR